MCISMGLCAGRPLARLWWLVGEICWLCCIKFDLCIGYNMVNNLIILWNYYWVDYNTSSVFIWNCPKNINLYYLLILIIFLFYYANLIEFCHCVVIRINSLIKQLKATAAGKSTDIRFNYLDWLYGNHKERDGSFDQGQETIAKNEI